MEIIKPKKEKQNKLSTDLIITPIVYLILGVILAFFSNEAVELVFYVLGIIAMIYGAKSLLSWYQNRDTIQYKNINLSMGIVSILIGLGLIIFSRFLEAGIRYVIGFFMIYFGLTKLMMQMGLGAKPNLSYVSNIALIVMGVFSIFWSNVILVIIGWLLIINAVLLFLEYIKK